MVESKGNVSDPAELHAEISRLRAEVGELHSQLSGKQGRVRDADTGHEHSHESTHDLPNRVADEFGKLMRGLALAGIEQFKLAGDLMSQLGEEVQARNHPDRVRNSETKSGRRPTPGRLVSDLPRNLYDGLNSIADQALEIPGRVVDKFYNAYKEAASIQASSEERELSRAERALSRAERISKERRHGKSDRKVGPVKEPHTSS